jgi:hypothetical protein
MAVTRNSLSHQAHTLQILQEFQSTSGLPNNYLMPETRLPVLQLVTKFPAFYETHKLTNFFHNSPSLKANLSQLYPVHALTTDLF